MLRAGVSNLKSGLILFEILYESNATFFECHCKIRDIQTQRDLRSIEHHIYSCFISELIPNLASYTIALKIRKCR